MMAEGRKGQGRAADQLQWVPDILGPDYQAATLFVPTRETADAGSGGAGKRGAGKGGGGKGGGGSSGAEPSHHFGTTVSYPEAGDSAPPHGRTKNSGTETLNAAETAAPGALYRATLVRHRPATLSTAVPGPAVLFLHGWSDYFFNTELAEFFTSRGYAFYALDLHNHGRSLGSTEMGGYVGNLADYDAEILAAHSAIAQDQGALTALGLMPHAGIHGVSPQVRDGITVGPSHSQNGSDHSQSSENHPIILMGHSTGGLIATLWAHHHPGLVSHLILNSPWLEIQGGAAIRRAATPLVQWADLRPLMRMRVPERSFYWRGISNQAYGEWPVDKTLRPPHAFPVRAGWMKAILAAQQEVATGLGLPMPIFVILSSKSMLGPVWSDAMLHADVVLDVRALALRTLSLGHSVTLERLDGALHEVFLSSKPVRTDGYARLERWLRGYVRQP